MSFTKSLKQEELQLLRNIVRKVNGEYFYWMEKKHTNSVITNRMLDQMIDSIGPEVAERMIKFGVDKGIR